MQRVVELLLKLFLLLVIRDDLFMAVHKRGVVEESQEQFSIILFMLSKINVYMHVHTCMDTYMHTCMDILHLTNSRQIFYDGSWWSINHWHIYDLIIWRNFTSCVQNTWLIQEKGVLSDYDYISYQVNLFGSRCFARGIFSFSELINTPLCTDMIELKVFVYKKHCINIYVDPHNWISFI